MVETVRQCGNSDFVGFPLPISIPPLIRTILSLCDSPAVFFGDWPFAGEAVLTLHSFGNWIDDVEISKKIFEESHLLLRCEQSNLPLIHLYRAYFYRGTASRR